MKTKTRYIVTITPKFPRWNYQPWEVEVTAASKAEANKQARRDLENQGHWFTREDAATFAAREAAKPISAITRIIKGI